MLFFPLIKTCLTKLYSCGYNGNAKQHSQGASVQFSNIFFFTVQDEYPAVRFFVIFHVVESGSWGSIINTRLFLRF